MVSYWTEMPMLRAVPATCFFAASRSLALRSGILVLAISSTWAFVTVPTTPSRPGVIAPLSIPAAWRSSTGVGGVLRMNVNERSSKTVISTGTIVPRWFSVCALYILQKSMIATPWGPSAVPTGGAGVAAPAGIWIFTIAATFFFAISVPLQLCHLGELQLHRSLASEDVDQHLELQLVFVDLDDLAREVGEGPLADPHGLAGVVLQPRLASLGGDLFVAGDDQQELLDIAP